MNKKTTTSTYKRFSVVVAIIATIAILATGSTSNMVMAQTDNGDGQQGTDWSGICNQIGNCELVTFYDGLPRCPDGYHRSPSGYCEPFNGYTGSPYTQSQIQQPPYPQQQYPLQQQPSLQIPPQQDQPLYNPNQVVACLNHVLVDRMVTVAITPNLLVLNNIKGVGPELNQTFVQNATNTLDSCIMPINQ